MTSPKKTRIFDGEHPFVGPIPGPLRIDCAGEVVWAVGGHSFGRALRYAEGSWTASELAHLPNFVVALSETAAIVAGEGGMVGRTHDAGATWAWERVGNAGWHVAASRDRTGRVWLGQQRGLVFRTAGPNQKFERVAELTGSINCVRQFDPDHAVVVTEKVVHRMVLATGKVTTLFDAGEANCIDAASDPTGRIVLVADGGRAWVREPGATTKFAPVETGADGLDFDAVFWVGGRFAILGYDGAVRTSPDGRAWMRIPVEKAVTRLGGIAAYRKGLLVGGLREIRGRQLGTLTFLGDPAAAPIAPALVLPAHEPREAWTAKQRAAHFVIAERNALLWATTWKALPDAETHAAAWMKLAAKLR